MTNELDFSDSALIGHLLSATILGKLVDKKLISVDDAIDILDEVLLDLEELQSLFPEKRREIEIARAFLSKSLDGYRTMRKEQSG